MMSQQHEASLQEPETPPEPKTALWKNRNYRLWFIGNTLDDIGPAVVMIALPLLVLAVTGSSEFAGILSALSMVVALLLTVPAGLVADAFDRRKTCLVTLPVTILTFTALSVLIFTGTVTVFWLTVLVLIGSAASAFFGQALSAMLRIIVPVEQFPAAVSLEEGRSAALGLGGGPLGGFLFGLSEAFPFAVRAIGSLAMFFTVAAMDVNARPSALRDGEQSPEYSPEPANGWWSKASSGFTTMARLPGIFASLVSAGFANLATNGFVMLLIMSWYADGVDPALIGLITASAFAGVLVGSVLAPHLVKRTPAGKLFMMALVALMLGLTPAVLGALPVVVLGAMLVAAMSLPALNAAFAGYMVAAVPNSHQGRVSAASSLVNMGVAPFAPLIAGFGLGLVGTELTAGIFLLLVGLGLINFLASPKARRIPTPDRWEEYAARRS